MFVGIEAQGYAMKAMENFRSLYSVDIMDGHMR